MRNSLLYTFSALFFVMLMAACQMKPLTKEAYLEEYGQFLEEIGDMEDRPTKEEWANLDDSFEKWNDTYYDEFKEDLTLGEKLQVKGYSITYRALRGAGKFQSNFTVDSENSKELERFVEKTGKNLEEALEAFTDDAGGELDDLGDVLENLGKKAERALDSFTDDAEDELEDLENVLEKLGNKMENAAENFGDDAEGELEGLGGVLEKLGEKVEKAAESFAKKVERDAEELERKIDNN